MQGRRYNARNVIERKGRHKKHGRALEAISPIESKDSHRKLGNYRKHGNSQKAGKTRECREGNLNQGKPHKAGKARESKDSHTPAKQGMAKNARKTTENNEYHWNHSKPQKSPIALHSKKNYRKRARKDKTRKATESNTVHGKQGRHRKQIPRWDEWKRDFATPHFFHHPLRMSKRYLGLTGPLRTSPEANKWFFGRKKIHPINVAWFK